MDIKSNQTLIGILFAGIIFFILFWVVNFFGISLPISVTSKTVSSELSVVGEGKVDVIPDTAEVTAGITIQNARTVEEAETKINEVNNKIVAAMINLGIAKEDIKTSNYSINPDYNYEPAGRSTLTGYTGNATLTIKVKDTNKLPQVITTATDAGANQVYNAGFSVDDPAKYREEARNKAIENAKEQAQKLASQLGIRLGKITNIVESSGGYPVTMFKEGMAQDLRVGGAPAPELQAGTQTITSTVTLYFERK